MAARWLAGAAADAGADAGAVTPQAAEMNHDTPPPHWYASAAELYRACMEMGKVWQAVGKSMGRGDITAHGAVLLKAAPELYTDLHASLNRTVNVSSTGTERCWQATADPGQNQAQKLPSFRGFSEMMYSGALTSSQVADIHKVSAVQARLHVLGGGGGGGGGCGGRGVGM